MRQLERVNKELLLVFSMFVGALLLAAFADLRVRKEGTDLKQRIAGLAVD